MLTVVQLGLTGTSVFMSVLSRVENADDGVCEVECSAGNERVSGALKSSLKLSSTGSTLQCSVNANATGPDNKPP